MTTNCNKDTVYDNYTIFKFKKKNIIKHSQIGGGKTLKREYVTLNIIYPKETQHHLEKYVIRNLEYM